MTTGKDDLLDLEYDEAFLDRGKAICLKDEETYNDLNDEEQSEWSYLPDIVLEQIFSYLSMRERYWASMVCRTWYRAFYLPKVWHIFVFGEQTLTRRRFNYYSGWQHFLDHFRTQTCLATIGKNFQVLVFAPTYNFHNMYDFMNMVSYYAEMQVLDRWKVKGIGNNVHTLRYTFPCNMADRQQAEASRLYGTGGRLLEAVKRLMRNLASLKQLELIDLMLERKEAMTLLDNVCCDCCSTLKVLHLVNPTKMHCQLLHVGVFINLRILVISPQNLGEDVIYLLSQGKLEHLHIIQNRYCPVDVKSVSAKSWNECRKFNSRLSVHLTLESIRERNMVWQEKAPVASVIYYSPQSRLDAAIIERTLEWYRDTLQHFGFLGLPRYHQPKSFHERLDPLLLMLCKQCPNLNTLIIRDRVSTATLLLIADNCKSLKYFFIRRNAIILRCDWPRNPDWTQEYYSWLKTSARSYERTEEEIAKKLKFSRWKMLSDKDFKTIIPNLY